MNIHYLYSLINYTLLIQSNKSINVINNLNPLIDSTGSLGTFDKRWRNAHIRDASVAYIDIGSNLNPRRDNIGSLGLDTRKWGNLHISLCTKNQPLVLSREMKII